VAGKFAGILAGSWVAVRLRLAVLPQDVHWAHMGGLAALGGIGFTVALFITGLAFTDTQLADAAKLAILVASTASALAGAALLWRPTAPAEERSPGGGDRVANSAPGRSSGP
jgi:NhaA family Na+:H+ antiporter